MNVEQPGASAFTELSDAPASYLGAATDHVAVNVTETGLEFVNSSGGLGTVTQFIFTNANGISGVVTDPTTTPTLVLSLGAITPTSVAASGTVTGSNLSGTNTGDNAVNSLYSGLATSKQDTLVSGTNIKTINSNSILGSGNLVVNGTTNLSYTAATRVIASDTGTDATLPLVTSTDAGLAPASGGGTSNFLRADGTWAPPPGGSGGLTALQVFSAVSIRM